MVTYIGKDSDYGPSRRRPTCVRVQNVRWSIRRRRRSPGFVAGERPRFSTEMPEPARPAMIGSSAAARLREISSGTALVFPGLLWMAVFLIVPLLLIIVLSLAWRGEYGPVDWGANAREFFSRLSLDNYLRLIDPLYLNVLWTSLRMAAVTTGVCLVVGYPVAYYLARSGNRFRNLLLFLLLIPSGPTSSSASTPGCSCCAPKASSTAAWRRSG
jgi:hypothetical protein